MLVTSAFNLFRVANLPYQLSWLIQNFVFHVLNDAPPEFFLETNPPVCFKFLGFWLVYCKRYQRITWKVDATSSAAAFKSLLGNRKVLSKFSGWSKANSKFLILDLDVSLTVVSVNDKMIIAFHCWDFQVSIWAKLMTCSCSQEIHRCMVFPSRSQHRDLLALRQWPSFPCL